jgi:chaperonin GroES
MRTFTPFGDRVLIKPITTAVKTTGLATPQSQKEVPTEGIVVAVGLGADAERTDQRGMPKEYNPAGVCIGERVQFAKYAGRDVMHNGVTHKLLRLEEIEGRIEDTPE